MKGLRVLVTGASGAIGGATGQELRRRGASVIGLDRIPGPDVLEADLRDDDAVARAVAAAIERLGGLDVLVNNAGIGQAHDAGATPDEHAIAIVDVNLFGAWRVTAAAMPALLETRGRVINVASGLALVNLPLVAAYAASKRALTAWSDSLRIEYGGAIAVTTVYPGYIRTPIHDVAARQGASLEGLVPAEPIAATVRAIVRSCTGRPRRNRASTVPGAVAYAAARHAPALVDWVVARRAQRALREGALGAAPIAHRARQHMRR